MIIIEIKGSCGGRKFRINSGDAMDLIGILDRLLEVGYDYKAKGYVLEGGKCDGPVSMVVVPGDLVERLPEVESPKDEPQCTPF